MVAPAHGSVNFVRIDRTAPNIYAVVFAIPNGSILRDSCASFREYWLAP